MVKEGMCVCMRVYIDLDVLIRNEPKEFISHMYQIHIHTLAKIEDE